MPSSRDPRTDPRRGDRLAKPGGESRRVVLVGPVAGRKTVYVAYEYGQGFRFSVALGEWRRWAKDAEVLHAARAQVGP